MIAIEFIELAITDKKCESECNLALPSTFSSDRDRSRILVILAKDRNVHG